MVPRAPFATRRLCAGLQIGAAAVLTLLAPVLLPLARAESPTPGGFLESATSTGVRPAVVVAMPIRGKFTFPAPYNTTGARLTNVADCGGAARDCVNDIGYAYWRNSNNHVGSDTMLIVVTLDRARGGNGPTLFGYDKNTDAVTVLGPPFRRDEPAELVHRRRLVLQRDQAPCALRQQRPEALPLRRDEPDARDDLRRRVL
jgi:hypothetical protein